MDAENNKQLIRQLYAELSDGNTQPFIDRLAKDIRWTVIGSTKFSGTIEGKQNVVNKLFSRVAAQLNGHGLIRGEARQAHGHARPGWSGVRRQRDRGATAGVHCALWRARRSADQVGASDPAGGH